MTTEREAAVYLLTKLAQEPPAQFVQALSGMIYDARQLANGCPCTLTTPCSSRCTCAHPWASGGCSRCCQYGSDEQRKAQAVYLAKQDPSAAAGSGATASDITRPEPPTGESSSSGELVGTAVAGGDSEPGEPRKVQKVELRDPKSAENTCDCFKDCSRCGRKPAGWFMLEGWPDAVMCCADCEPGEHSHASDRERDAARTELEELKKERSELVAAHNERLDELKEIYEAEGIEAPPPRLFNAATYAILGEGDWDKKADPEPRCTCEVRDDENPVCSP